MTKIFILLNADWDNKENRALVESTAEANIFTRDARFNLIVILRSSAVARTRHGQCNLSRTRSHEAQEVIYDK